MRPSLTPISTASFSEPPIRAFFRIRSKLIERFPSAGARPSPLRKLRTNGRTFRGNGLYAIRATRRSIDSARDGRKEPVAGTKRRDFAMRGRELA
jgi:hypothetical protein